MPVKWEFYDPTDMDTYTFEVNPNSGGSPQYRKSIIYKNTAAPDGKTLVFEGRNEVADNEFSGVILSEAQYDAMITWFNKRHQIQVTDDLGREYMIYITAFEPRRERARSHPWKHSYSVRYVLVDS